MDETQSLPEYSGKPIVSATAAVNLIETYDPSSVLREFADHIVSRAYENGVDSLTPVEAQFAALELYQNSAQSDWFASIFYNKSDFLGAMLTATEKTGADHANALLRRGLAILGLSDQSSESELDAACQRLSNAVDGAIPNTATEDELVEAFTALDDEFEAHVVHLDEQMIALLKAETAAFKNFP